MNEARERFAFWVHGIRSARGGCLLREAGVMARIKSEWMRDEAAAKEFWTLVLNESHPDPDHETRKLARLLMGRRLRRLRADRLRRAAAPWRRLVKRARAAFDGSEPFSS